MKLLWLVSIFLPLSSHVYSEEKLPRELENLIVSSNNSKDFINSLPPKYRDHYVLLYEGHAGIKASVSEPRMIFYDDKTLISVGRNEIEVMDWDKESNDYDFSKFNVSADGFQRETLDVKKQCLNCHTNREAIWEGYATWCGVYGGDNSDTPSEAEQLWLKKYTEKFKDVFPIKELKERRKEFVNQADPCQKERSHELHGAQALGNVVANNQHKTILSKIMQSQEYLDSPLLIQKSLCASTVFTNVLSMDQFSNPLVLRTINELINFIAGSEKEKKKLEEEMSSFNQKWKKALNEKYDEGLDFELAPDPYAYAIPFLQRKILYKLGLSEVDLNSGHNRPEPGKISKLLNPRCREKLFNIDGVKMGHSSEYPSISAGFGLSNGEEEIVSLLALDFDDSLGGRSITLNPDGKLAIKDLNGEGLRRYCKKLIEGTLEIDLQCVGGKALEIDSTFEGLFSSADELWAKNLENSRKIDCEKRQQKSLDPWKEPGDSLDDESREYIENLFK